MDSDHNHHPHPANKRTARLFRNGSNQAVRLPREYEIQAEEVYIERNGDVLVLTPKPKNWDSYFAQARRLGADMPDQVEDALPREPEAL
jgi:antitoxin VapB